MLRVGFPLIVLLAEWRFLRTGDAVYSALARAWTKALGVLFAVGAVSGTILSFELGILWPRFMGRFGEVIGLPFAMEGIAFFVEAIFVGLYLYGWDRLPPRVHLLTGVPIVVAGVASAWFVVTAAPDLFAGQYPYLLEGEVTIRQAAADPATLRAVLLALIAGAVLFIPALVALFVMAQRDTAPD